MTTTEDRLPLSATQEFLCALDQGDTQGPFGPRHHIVHGWHVRGEVDVESLRGALDDVVERHEQLRTLIVRDPEQRYQVVGPADRVELVVRDLRDVASGDLATCVDDLLIDAENTDFSVYDLPHLRAELVRFDDRNSLLVLIVHHTAADGWSVRVIVRDIAARYAVRTGHVEHELPEVPQHRDFTTWESSKLDDPADEPSREFWRDKLRGVETLAMPADRPRSAGLPQTTAVLRFGVDADLMAQVRRLGREVRGSSFMVLLAAFTVAAHRLSGATDIATPTFTPGRANGRFDETVGVFYNLLPLRVGLDDCETYRDVVARARKTCVEAYRHDIPQIPAASPAFMRPAMVDDEVPIIFQVFPYPYLLDGERVGDLEFTEVRDRLVSQARTSDIPDGVLWTLNIDTTGELIGAISYKDALVDEDTIAEWVACFREELRTCATAPDGALRLGTRQDRAVDVVADERPRDAVA